MTFWQWTVDGPSSARVEMPRGQCIRTTNYKWSVPNALNKVYFAAMLKSGAKIQCVAL